MKKLTLSFIILAGIFSLASKAQAVSPPTATPHQVSLAWTNTCATSLGCAFIPYRIGGTCPASLTGTGWTQLTTTAANATTATDTTVVASTQYSYIVEATIVVNGLPLLSGPSNCTTLTVPNGPSPATGLSATAS